MAKERTILIVEDDTDFAQLIRIHLEDLGHQVEVANDGVSGCNHLDRKNYDLVILDIMLPGVDGYEICRRIRAKSSYTPLMMLTARTAEMDRVLGLELGADDYLTKPVSTRELVARVKAIFRRVDHMGTDAPPEVDETGKLQFGDLLIDSMKHQVSLRDEEVNLTAKEFDLLLHFARNPGRVYTRRDLLDSVWGYGFDGYEHTVNSHINRLRSKIERDPSQPRWIHTVWGVGYKFVGE